MTPKLPRLILIRRSGAFFKGIRTAASCGARSLSRPACAPNFPTSHRTATTTRL